VFPVFLDDSRVLAVKGEARHRRSYVYDLESLSVTKVFHNNTIRTIAPEYEWAATPDGSKLFVVSERDGDTVSPERGLYMVHLDREVTLEQVVARLEENLEAESDLRARGEEIFGPSAGRIRPVTEAVSEARIYGYAKDLFDFGSKHITHPGNALAIDYLTETLREWGYEPELQWFEPQPGVRTANVIARLQGTVDPDLVYVISSHFDSHQRGPGADDDTSATTALLEVARVLRDHPQPATIEFAFFTGEESGLLGSREYVRLALEGEKRIVGALNNDMVGWANDHRLDNTIRYSNPGIRDIQHAAAIQFSDLITYDALYYKNTDAHAYYEVYGDIVGGIGSYPVLGNPNYHQVTDLLETVNHRLVAEVARTSAATLMALASSPARLGPLQASLVGGQALEISWDASPETGVTAYRVRYRNPGEEWQEVRVGQPSVVLEGLQEGAEVRVKALGADGTEGWDWSRAVLTR
jgi:aminopeptidase YwaD